MRTQEIQGIFSYNVNRFGWILGVKERTSEMPRSFSLKHLQEWSCHLQKWGGLDSQNFRLDQ